MANGMCTGIRCWEALSYDTTGSRERTQTNKIYDKSYLYHIDKYFTPCKYMHCMVNYYTLIVYLLCCILKQSGYEDSIMEIVING